MLRPLRVIVAALFALALVGALAAAWLWSALWLPRSQTPVEIVIEPGTSGRGVLEQLCGAGPVPSPPSQLTVG